MVDPSTRQKVGASDIPRSSSSRSRTSTLKWIKGSKEVKEQAETRSRPVLAAHRGDREGEAAQARAHEARRRAASRRARDGQGLPRHQASALGRRQDGRPSRQQGRHRPHRARRGHAVPRGRHAGGRAAQPAGRAQPHERRPDPRDPPRLGGAGARLPGGHAGLRRCHRGRGARGDRRSQQSRRDGPPVGVEGAARTPGHGRASCSRRCPPAARSSCTTAAPASRSTSGPPSATCTCSSCTTSWTTRSTRVRPARTRSSPSSRWAARPARAASASARWKSGRSRRTAPPTSCRNC